MLSWHLYNFPYELAAKTNVIQEKMCLPQNVIDGAVSLHGKLDRAVLSSTRHKWGLNGLMSIEKKKRERGIMTISVTRYQPISWLTGDSKKCFQPSSSKQIVTFQSSNHMLNWYQSALKAVLSGFDSQIPHHETSTCCFLPFGYFFRLSVLSIVPLTHTRFPFSLVPLVPWFCFCCSLHLSLDFLCCKLCQFLIMRIELPWQPVAPGTIDHQGSTDISSTVYLHSPSFKSS